MYVFYLIHLYQSTHVNFFACLIRLKNTLIFDICVCVILKSGWKGYKFCNQVSNQILQTYFSPFTVVLTHILQLHFTTSIIVVLSLILQSSFPFTFTIKFHHKFRSQFVHVSQSVFTSFSQFLLKVLKANFGQSFIVDFTNLQVYA